MTKRTRKAKKPQVLGKKEKDQKLEKERWEEEKLENQQERSFLTMAKTTSSQVTDIASIEPESPVPPPDLNKGSRHEREFPPRWLGGWLVHSAVLPQLAVHLFECPLCILVHDSDTAPEVGCSFPANRSHSRLLLLVSLVSDLFSSSGKLSSAVIAATRRHDRQSSAINMCRRPKEQRPLLPMPASIFPPMRGA